MRLRVRVEQEEKPQEDDTPLMGSTDNTRFNDRRELLHRQRTQNEQINTKYSSHDSIYYLLPGLEPRYSRYRQ